MGGHKFWQTLPYSLIKSVPLHNFCWEEEILSNVNVVIGYSLIYFANKLLRDSTANVHYRSVNHSINVFVWTNYSQQVISIVFRTAHYNVTKLVLKSIHESSLLFSSFYALQQRLQISDK